MGEKGLAWVDREWRWELTAAPVRAPRLIVPGYGPGARFSRTPPAPPVSCCHD